MNEQAISRELGEGRTREAFEEVVRENVDLVYGAACRQVRDPHLAEDVTQAVFILLSRKGGTVKGPVAGWLIKATYYCCRDARRLARRRAYHERQAMAIRPSVTEKEGEEVAGETMKVDEALLRLRAKDRDAITLRYLQGKSLRETGELLGIGEEAARKRVNRAVERLRAAVAADAGVSLSAMTASLAGHAAIVAPAGLAKTISAAAGAAANGTLAGTIADAGVRAWWWAQAKWPAGLAAAALLVGGSVGASRIFHKRPMVAVPALALATAPAPVVAAAPVSAANPDEDESHVRGDMQLARWDLLFDASALPMLQKIAAPVDSPSKLYQAYRCKGVDLRRAVRTAIDGGALIRGSDEMAIASAFPTPKELWFVEGPYFQHMDDPSTPVMLLGGSTSGKDSFVRTAPDRLHIKLDHPDFRVSVAALSADTKWIEPPNQALGYEGDLGPGDALVFLGQLPAVDGRLLLHVIAWESFQLDGQQEQFSPEERDARWWCEHGPAQLRQWANAARVWAAKVPANSVVPINGEIKLEDGKVLHLEGLCRPAKWPNCWWDAQGNPVKSQNKIIAFEGDPPEGLFAYLTTTGGAADEEHRRNPSYLPQEGGQFGDHACEAIDDADGAITVGVAVGPWKKLATLELNKPQTIDGVKYVVRKPVTFGDTEFLVHFSRSGVLENDDLLLPTAADGSVAATSAEPTILFTRNTEQQVKNEQPNYHRMALAKVARYDLMQRKRVWVSFDHAAMEPKVAPPASVTADAVQSAEQAAEGRARDATLADTSARRKAWAAIKPDRKNILGTARLLVDAVRAGDAKAVRGLLTASKPAAVACLDSLPELLIAGEQTRRTLREKLGRDLTNEERLPLGASAFLFGDFEEELFSQPWSTDKNGIAHEDNRPNVMVPDAEGNYALSVDDLASIPSPQEYLHGMIELAKRVQMELQKRPTITVSELTAMVRDASVNKNGPSPQ